MGFQELPDDVLAMVSGAMQYRDVMNLSLTCKNLRAACESDKLWMPQCRHVVEAWCGELDLMGWRSGVESCKALFRFLQSVRSLLGIWVHQNPELGNVVYVTWGFVSVVACRIIPQEVGSSGLDDTVLLWAPVFEIVGNRDGSLAFFLHGRERDRDYCYPGRFQTSKENPNVLLLEAEPLVRTAGSPESPDSPLVAMIDHNDVSAAEDCKGGSSKASSKASKGKKKTAATDPIPFHRLAFGDRRRLLEVLAPQVRLRVASDTIGPMLPRSCKRANGNGTSRATTTTTAHCANKTDSQKVDLLPMIERRSRMLCMYSNSADPGSQCKAVESQRLLLSMCTSSIDNLPGAAQNHDASSKNVETLDKGKMPAEGNPAIPVGGGGKGQSDSYKKSGFAQFVRAKMKQIVGKSIEQESRSGGTPCNADVKQWQLQEFLKQGIAVGLRLHATNWKLNFYRAWPIMHDNRFALYKILEQKPEKGREHAGLWGGTFGWPPGLPAVDDKPGKALFFLLLSYEESEEGPLLIATKILEGTHHVLHPNGSAMFTAKINTPSADQFPWETNTEGGVVNILQSYQGEGISNGYGFRYPGSKPGDLFVDSNGVLAFVWRESRTVLTLKRLDLQSLLEKGERVAALPPIANFAYLTKSYSNVFAGYCGNMAIAARAKGHQAQE